VLLVLLLILEQRCSKVDILTAVFILLVDLFHFFELMDFVFDL
jgi:hypothetical protein